MTASRTDVRVRIVEQAARLLQEEGPAAVTTRGVADAAGVQAPTIYRLFGDKAGLLDAVTEHVLATYVASKAASDREAASGDVDPVEDLREGWRRQIEFSVANPTLFALLSDPERAAGSPAARAGQQVLAGKVHRLAVAGLLRVPEDRARHLLHAAGTGAALTVLAEPPERRDLGLAEDALEAVLGAILLGGAPARTDHATAAAVTLRAVAPGLTVLSEPERALLVEWLDRVVEAPAGDGPGAG